MKHHILLLAGLLSASTTFAAKEIDIVKDGSSKLTIDVSTFATDDSEAARTFKTVLATDLKRSGWFDVVSGGGSIAIVGACTIDASAVKVACDVKSVSQGRFMNKSYEEAPARFAALAHKVADDIVMAIKKVPGIASSRILMIGKRGGKQDLYICDYDGRNMQQITRDQAICMSPSWTPDAKKIAYTSYAEQNRPIIYMINLEAKTRSRIADYPGLDTGAAISRDGASMAMILSKDGNPELYVMNLAAKSLTRLTVTQKATEASPTWSPDGKKIAYVCDKSGSPQIYIRDRSGGDEKRVSLIGRENVAPDWGPDGRLVWTTRREGRYQLCVLDPSTGKEEVLDTKADRGFDYEDPSWAPDGRHIVVSRTGGYHADVYVLDTMGDPPIRITDKEGEWYSPVWSPR